MRKIIFAIMVFVLAANVSAQLKVDAAGQVGIGTTNPQYKLDITGDTRVAGDIYLGSSSNILGTTGYFPIIFKVNDIVAGFTGNHLQGNVSFGYGSLLNYTVGTYNTAIGSSALRSNNSNATTGDYNTAIGSSALYFNTSGGGNTASGAGALLVNTSGHHNTADGNNALLSNTTGNYNSAIGYSALQHNTTGSFNSAIGFYAGGDSPDNLTNSTSIGYASSVTGSNQVRIGNGNVTSIGGFAGWTIFSDKRAKTNVRTDVPGLAFINRLQPVTFNLDLDAIDGLLKIDKTKKRPGEKELPQELIDAEKKAREAKEKVKQTGFIAQDVEEIAKSIGYDFSGVDVDETGIYGLRYAEFVVPLVKAVQELSAQVNELTELVHTLQGKDALLKSGSAVESATGLQAVANSGAALQQNNPNPFNQSTVIRYTLPQTGKQAQIVISNTAGSIVRQIPLQAGTESITIEGGALSAGIYYYSLYVGNSLADTKKMILTK
ncbi:MAG: tail fiber domain-containing protein [Dysgonamonadaceae bacterium]|jgi:hypothetical protein|nr:tail fiber domain-containing protein [Dysgonamonadaceae bacterium]